MHVSCRLHRKSATKIEVRTRFAGGRQQNKIMDATMLFLFSVIQLFYLFIVAEQCSSFVVESRNSFGRKGKESYQCRLSASNNNEENNNPENKSKPDRPYYTRSPDYPFFAYDDNSDFDRNRNTRRVSFNSDKKRATNPGESSQSSSSSSVSAPRKLYDVLAPLESDFLISGVRDSNRRTRLLNRRSYTSREPFEQRNINDPPCLHDLKPPPSPSIESFWISVPYRVLSFALPYFSFPFLIGFLDLYVTMKPDQLADITSKFGPGVSILYGTFISLTLSILYERQKDIQNDAAVEASLLALITRTLLNIFRSDEASSVEVGQSCADQIRILAKGSRGSELLAIMYSDPYARMLEIIEKREATLMARNSGDLGGEAVAIGSCRQILEDLFKIRADRLSDESLAIPPTHFFIMTILTGFILLGYAIVSSSCVLKGSSILDIRDFLHVTSPDQKSVLCSHRCFVVFNKPRTCFLPSTLQLEAHRMRAL